MAASERKYQVALNYIISFPKTVMLFVGSLFIISIFLLSTLGGEFIPALEEGNFAVDTRVLPGSSITTTIIIKTALAGQSTGMLFEGEKQFEVVVKISESEKKTLRIFKIY